MEKEIIGYKLKDDCKQYEKAVLAIIECDKLTYLSSGCNFHGGSRNYAILKKAEVLDLWFEPVYKPIIKEDTFKKGEYVVWTLDGYVGKVRGRYKKETNPEEEYDIRLKTNDRHNCCNIKYLRKATTEEIERTVIQQLQINDKYVEVKDNGIKVGCEELTWQEVIDFVRRTEKAGHMRQLTLKEQRTLYQLQTYASKQI